ncbi:hypothetical protein [Geomicrobium sediminis]|uniref:Uncharacterized protein n=1 Tax=Geomicrobium sediminis TaxID=1347788 RepID=A0ABS2PFM1_9BACL|nr:hypothetical protein [Geomicrobium sediminis]EZH64344.1 hypothetical protein DH09_01115 [Bacillaceae bacterium JMAK1]MBM7634224.1 hypothetical protein [Geomicrobium sediminis]
MNSWNCYVQQSLLLSKTYITPVDIPYVESILHTINQAQTPLKNFPNLNQAIPITVVDPELIQND